MAVVVDLAAAVEELYGLDPGSFTARRDAIVASLRKEGDRDLATAVKALRRPSAAAHAVNLLARSSPGELAQLVSLGDKLRLAQESLSAEDLRALGRQRSQLVAQMARQAAGLVGSPVSDAARREIEATLEAAMGDTAASAAVQSGNLVRALERTGLDPVDLEGAVAGEPGGAGRPRRPPESATAGPGRGEPDAAAATRAHEAARAEARSALDEAAERLGEARRVAEEARHLLAGATAGRDQAEARVEELARELAEARQVAEDAADQQRKARRRTADAESDVEEAAKARDRAEARLRDLEGGGG